MPADADADQDRPGMGAPHGGCPLADGPPDGTFGRALRHRRRVGCEPATRRKGRIIAKAAGRSAFIDRRPHAIAAAGGGTSPAMFLLIDNYDSFTFNLWHFL
jgi:hypothetical protein